MNRRSQQTIRRSCSTWLLLVAAGVAGCRSVDNAQVDLLERELRQQEDYIYELEDYLVEYSEKLRRCRCANESHPFSTKSPAKNEKPEIPEPELVDDSPTADEDVGPVPDLADEPLPVPTPADAPPEEGIPDRIDQTPIEPDGIDIEDLDDLDVPNLEIGPDPSGQAPQPAEAPIQLAAAQRRLEIPDPVDYLDEPAAPPAEQPAVVEQRAVVEQPAAAPAAASRHAAERVVIRRVMLDDPPAADQAAPGLLTVIELQNGLGEPVEVDGQASVMVLTRDEPQRRVQRWDFLADEAAAAWQSSILGDGLHLLLPLEAQVLADDEYELWARIVTADGEKLLAKAIFQPTQLVTLAEAEAALVDDETEGLALAEAPQQRDAAPPATPPPAPTAVDDGGRGWKRSDEPVVRTADLRGSQTSGRASWTRSTRAERFVPQRPVPTPKRPARATERWTPFQ